MTPLRVPSSDVNSATCIVVRWRAGEGQAVSRDQVVAEVETSKALIEVAAPHDGLLLPGEAAGTEVEMGAIIGHLFADAGSLAAFQKEEAARAGGNGDAAAARGNEFRATRRAEELARRHGVDLAALRKTGLITSADVKEELRKARPADPAGLPEPLGAPPGVERVLIIGGGLGAVQVLEILRGDPARAGVAILDDDPGLWGQDRSGVPIAGGTDRLGELFSTRAFDAAIVAISTSVPARVKFRERCRDLGIPLASAIDRTARIAADAAMGEGNVVCAFCHFGAGAVVGDNNFFSAYNSIDHHCVVGSDLSTGPGCMVSGIVKLGSRIRMGAGIFIEPYLEIGDGVQIASGSIILQSVPAGHAVKAKVGRTSVVPIR